MIVKATDLFPLRATLSDIDIYTEDMILIFGHEWRKIMSVTDGPIHSHSSNFRVVGGQSTIRIRFDSDGNMSATNDSIEVQRRGEMDIEKKDNK